MSNLHVMFVNVYNLPVAYIQLYTKVHCDREHIENVVTHIKPLFLNIAKNIFRKRTVISSKIKHKKKKKTWFGLQCYKAQKKKNYSVRRNNNIQRNDASRRRLLNSCNKYKSTVKKFHKQYIQNFQQKLKKKLCTENPKDCWKLINRIDKRREELPLDMQTLVDYFKTLNVEDVNSKRTD